MKLKKFLLLIMLFLLPILLTACGKEKYADNQNIKKTETFYYIISGEEEQEIIETDEFGEKVITIVDGRYIEIVGIVKNAKVASIPQTIEGFPVKSVAQFAFFEYTKLLGLVTIPKSKLESIVFPEGLETIGKFSFYQAKKLKSITIPASVKTIDVSAFSNASDVKQLKIDRVEPDYKYYESESFGELDIFGGRSAYLGDIFALTASKTVTWISKNTDIATITYETGTGRGIIKALKVGTYTIEARETGSGTAIATITMEVVADNLEQSIKIGTGAFDRLYGLETLTVNIKNPNIITMQADEIKLQPNVKIYVPESSVAFYKAHASWKRYEAQIFPINK